MKRTALFIITLVTWILLVWPFDFVERTFDWQSFWLGTLVSLGISLYFGEVLIQSPHKYFSIRRFLWFLYYIPIFTYYCIKANLDVMYRVLHPEMPIKPGIVKVKTTLKSDSGRTALCNSITLTPGTLTVDITDDGYLYIHWINVQSTDVEEATKMIVEKFEKILRRIFE